MGSIMLERGDLTSARSWATQALAMSEASGDASTVMYDRRLLAGIECAAGRLDDAQAHIDKAWELQPETEPGRDGVLLTMRADLALAGTHPEDAVSLANAALQRANELNDHDQQCESLRRVGDAQLAIDQPGGALATFEQLIATAGAIPYPCRVAEGHEGAAAASYVLGRATAAHGYLTAAAEIRERTNTQRLRRPAVEAHLATLEKRRRPVTVSEREE